jgi:hypothetical protein
MDDEPKGGAGGDAPNGGDAPRPPVPEVPKVEQPTAPPKPPSWLVTPELKDFIQELPDLPPPTGTSSSKSCDVIKFDYPVPGSFMTNPGNGVVGPKKPPGFRFMASIEYNPIAPYACECCVFRQWLQKTKSGIVGKRFRDRKPNGKEYGGSRADGSDGDAKDNKDKEAAGTKVNTPCKLEFEDLPREGGVMGDGSYWDILYEFVGLVFDRCNNWKPVAIKIMTMARKTSYVYQEGPHKSETDIPLVVVDEEGSVKLNGEQVR